MSKTREELRAIALADQQEAAAAEISHVTAATPTPAPTTCEVRVLGRKHTVTWNASDPVSVAEARGKVAMLLETMPGAVMFRMTDTINGERINTFDPTAEHLLIIPPMSGGGV